MPVIIVGADTPIGTSLIEAMASRQGEVRAFVTDPDTGRALQRRGIKVAVGDVSDGSHVGGAALNAFCAVLIPDAATDDRERSFADTPDAVYSGWADGLKDAKVQRVIWLDDGTGSDGVDAIAAAVPEFVAVELSNRPVDDVIADIVDLDAAASL